MIWSDPRLLEQMVRNLLSNALKYTRTGKVLLGCRRQGGSLATSASSWVIASENNLVISSPIVETNTATNLVKTGAGTLTLCGSNTYAGNTFIEQGTLAVSSDSNLGVGSGIQIEGGILQANASFSSLKGFGGGWLTPGTINTNGYNLTFAGANSGAIIKSGSGTLTLSNPGAGAILLNQGMLALPNAKSGFVSLYGGTLLVSGDLSQLNFFASATLDLGTSAAGHLTTTSASIEIPYEQLPSFQLTIDFGVGSKQSDLWTIGSDSNPPGDFPYAGSNPVLFDFSNLGGAATGVNYPLVDLAGTYPPPFAPDSFAVSPDSAAAGWAGTFTTSGTTLYVNFSSVPEPGPIALLLVAAGALSFHLRRLRNH